MGGNALKTIETRRYELIEYSKISTLVTTKLLSMESIMRAVTIPHIKDKQSFGDLDVLYSTSTDNELYVNDVHQMFDPKELVKNSEVMSFNVDQLQVDIIHSPRSLFDYAINYFSWNDAGNLVGKLCHKLGLKHGHRGLVLPLRDGDNMFSEVMLTLNHDRTLKFLGLDPIKYNDGFDSLHEMFEYIASSPYYNPEFYKLENLNTIARVRDRKRSTYNKFLEFGLNYTGPKWEDCPSDKSVHLERIFTEFPDAYQTFVRENEHIAARKYLRSKFNGHLVSEWTGLRDRRLGEFMARLKGIHQFKEGILLYLPEKTIRQNVLDFYASSN